MDNISPIVARMEGLVRETSRLLRHRRILVTLLENPGREFTIRELSVESQTPYATTWRLVEMLRALGALRVRRVGASHSLSLNARSPLVPELRRLAGVRLQPHREAARRFARLAAGVRGVWKIVLFGSAARGAAEPGSDVDVAVILDRRADDVLAWMYESAAKIQDETGLKIVPVGLTRPELEAGTRFARVVRAGEVLYERP